MSVNARLVALVALVVVAGCDHGVELDVLLPPGVCADLSKCHVEVLIAASECHDGVQVDHCSNSLAWDTATRKEAGRIFILDQDDIFSAPVASDRFASFRIDSTAAETGIARLVAIAYEDQTVVGMTRLKDVTIPLHRAERWEVRLDPPLPDIPNEAVRDVARMHVWQRLDPGMSKCIALEDPQSSDPAGVFEFLVPPGDTDCDDETIECDHYWAHFKPRPDCLNSDPLGSPACRIGTTMCADGVSSTGGPCRPVATDTCTAGALCSRCSNAFDQSCLMNVFSDGFNVGTTFLPHFSCTYPFDPQTGGPCASPEDTGTLDLDSMIPLTASCESLRFVPEVIPLFPPQAALVFNNLTFKPAQDSAKRCAFDLQFAAGMVPTNGALPLVRGFLDFTLHSKKHMWIPFEVGFATSTPGCGAGVVRAICVGDNFGMAIDPVFTCAAP